MTPNQLHGSILYPNILTLFAQFNDLVNAEKPTNEDELWVLARKNRDLLKFMLSRKDLPQLLARVSRAAQAPAVAARLSRSRLQILSECCDRGRCCCPNAGVWHLAATQVCHLNNYKNRELQLAIVEALCKGRAKGRNIFIVGDTNRAKSFTLRPLEMIFKAFVPPDSGSHQLADIQGSEILWLNDFEFSTSFMTWSRFKDFLEGSALKVAVPKSSGNNYLFTSDAPVFGTSPGIVKHPAVQKETDQMNSRIKYFHFVHYFDPSVCPEIKPCAHCFARWLLHG